MSSFHDAWPSGDLRKRNFVLFCFNSKPTFFISIIFFLYNLPFLWIPPLWVLWKILAFDFVFVCCFNCSSLAAGTMLNSQRRREICLLTGWWMTKQTLAVLSQFWPQFPLISSPAAGADLVSQSPWGLALISSDVSVQAGVSQLGRWYHGPDTPLPINIGPRQRPLEQAWPRLRVPAESLCLPTCAGDRAEWHLGRRTDAWWTVLGKNHPQRRAKKREHDPWQARRIYGNQCPLRLPL